jgi:hypothetical protein
MTFQVRDAREPPIGVAPIATGRGRLAAQNGLICAAVTGCLSVRLHVFLRSMAAGCCVFCGARAKLTKEHALGSGSAGFRQRRPSPAT